MRKALQRRERTARHHHAPHAHPRKLPEARPRVEAPVAQRPLGGSPGRPVAAPGGLAPLVNVHPVRAAGPPRSLPRAEHGVLGCEGLAE